MRLMLFGALISAAICAACSPENCDEYVATPVEGSYSAVEGSYNGDADAFLVASADEVVVTYTRPDGARFRAVYRVREKRNEPR